MLWGAVAPPRLLQPPGSVPLGCGIHWESSEIHRNPTKSTEIHWQSSENPLKSSGIHRNPLESMGNPRISPAADSRKTTKIAGKSRKITGGPTKNHPENGPKNKNPKGPPSSVSQLPRKQPRFPGPIRNRCAAAAAARRRLVSRSLESGVRRRKPRACSPGGGGVRPPLFRDSIPAANKKSDR